MEETGKINAGGWEMLRQGDESAFYNCFHHCYNDLYRLGLFLYKDPELVKESIHLLFIELWKIKDKLPGVINIKEYTLTIFKRILYKQKTCSVNYWSKMEMIDDNDEVNEAAFISSYEEMLINTQEDNISRNRLAVLMEELSDRQRQLIRMRFFEEKTIDEMAQLTELTSRTIYNTLQNALVRLKELMA